MPNESENLEYRFEGSDSSFQAAAKRVSSMLDTLSKKSAAIDVYKRQIIGHDPSYF